MGCTLAPTSMGIALNVLKQAKMLNTPTGQLIIAAAVLDDVIALLLLSELQAPRTVHTPHPPCTCMCIWHRRVVVHCIVHAHDVCVCIALYRALHRALRRVMGAAGADRSDADRAARPDRRLARPDAFLRRGGGLRHARPHQGRHAAPAGAAATVRAARRGELGS